MDQQRVDELAEAEKDLRSQSGMLGLGGPDYHGTVEEVRRDVEILRAGGDLPDEAVADG
ncbi:MAG: hypothetical protein WC553_01130 [Patescibacteria group bacterium]